MPINKVGKFSTQDGHTHFAQKVTGKIAKTARKIKQLLKPSPKELKIHHLGGVKLGSFDPEGKQTKMHGSYFYERIAVHSKSGEIHTYGGDLKKYVKAWDKERSKGKSDLDFSKWMEEKGHLAKVEKKNVRYLTDEERAKTEVKVEGGKLIQVGLHREGRDPAPLDEGAYAFVLTDVVEGGEITSKLFATPKVKTESGKIQHSSLTRGGNVKSVGMLYINDKGDLIAIKDFSGHYRPGKKEMAKLCSYLINEGFSLKGLTVTIARHQIFHAISHFLHLTIKRGFVMQEADRWFENEGKKLLKEES